MFSAQLRTRFIEYFKTYIELTNEGVPRTELPFILTHNGVRYCHGAPRPEDVLFDDVAHALSRICRFTGHVNVPHYSVAQHSVLVSYACDPADALDGLMHDASEAYLADLSRPLKYAPGMETYKHYEALTAKSVCQAFGLKDPEPESVRLADLILCLTEARDLLKHESMHIWSEERSKELGLTLLEKRIKAWPQAKAEREFRKRFDELQMKAWREASRDKGY